MDNVESLNKEFKLLNIVVDVAFKLFIDKIDDVDKLFKFDKVELPVNAFIIPNNVVDVAFKLFIANIDDVDRLVISVLIVAVDRFKVDMDVLLLFIIFNNDVDVAFIL